MAQLRPRQWTKNGLVLAALLFTIPHVSLYMVWESVAAALLFSLVSGCVYILNDLVDLESDRSNPDKNHRPMASGRLQPRLAAITGSLLFLLVLAFGWWLKPWLTVCLVGYFALNVGYSTYLKKVVLVDVFVIAAGFVLRAAAGGVAISVPLTPWFLCAAMFLSLFLAVGKRRYEFNRWQQDKTLHRPVLRHYSSELLNQLTTITASAVVMTYSIFTFLSGHTRYLMLTIPLVMYGVFRYLHLMSVKNAGGSPETVLLTDKHILITVLLFGFAVVVLLFLFH